MRHGWNEERIRSAQATLLAEIEAGSFANPADRLAFLLQRLDELPFERSSLMERYVLTMSALVHHRRHGGLTPAQINRLAEAALVVLRLGGIDPRQSKLSFLYSDMHLILSQIQRTEGRQIRSQAQQRLAYRYCGLQQLNGPDVHDLAAGIRDLRAGHSWRARQNFERCIQETQSEARRALAELWLCRSLRLSGDHTEARSLVETHAHRQGEWLWERAALSASTDGDLEPMLDLVRSQASSEESHFLTYLWTLAIQSKRFQKQASLPKESSHESESDSRRFYQCCREVRLLTQPKDPLETRLARLPKFSEKIELLASIEQVLLLLAAIARWLYRVEGAGLFELFLDKYAAQSLVLSVGRSRDALRCFGDL